MKTSLVFKIGIFILFWFGFILNTFGQEDDFKVLRVSIDTNRALYPTGQHGIIVEWTEVTDTQVVRLDIHQTDNFYQPDPIKKVYDFSNPIDTIKGHPIVSEVNNDGDRKITVFRMEANYDSITNTYDTNVFYTGDLDLAHQTIFLRSNPDDCAEEVVLSWTPYPRYGLGNIEVIVLESINNSRFEPIDTVSYNSEDISSFATIRDIDLENLPSYVVRMVTSTGHEVFSNIHTPDVDFPGLPDYMISTHSENNQQNISLFYDIDPASELDSFVLKRAAQPQGNYTYFRDYNEVLSGNFTAQFNRGDSDSLYFYKLFAYNKCGKARDSSNVNHPIVLQSTGNDRNTYHLEWNEYIGFDDQNGLSHYNIIGDTTIGPISEPSYSINVTDTLTIRIAAVENDPDPDTSLSNTITLYPEIQVYFSEAYRIGDPAVIAPTIENTVLDYYEIKVFNRNGIMVYSNTIEETISEFDDHQKWDGTYNNSYVPPGTYIYHMIYSLPGSNQRHLKKGYFILVE